MNPNINTGMTPDGRMRKVRGLDSSPAHTNYVWEQLVVRTNTLITYLLDERSFPFPFLVMRKGTLAKCVN